MEFNRDREEERTMTLVDSYNRNLNSRLLDRVNFDNYKGDRSKGKKREKINLFPFLSAEITSFPHPSLCLSVFVSLSYATISPSPVDRIFSHPLSPTQEHWDRAPAHESLEWSVHQQCPQDPLGSWVTPAARLEKSFTSYYLIQNLLSYFLRLSSVARSHRQNIHA